ncbi:MAG TPA: hypothetical protein VKE40_23900 [Gemmataceae bacterium]|nr:hypothetical protein [Gemmataceae bacterium]
MFQVVAEAVLYAVCGLVGHGLLWVLTLGRWRPTDARDDAALLVGLLFWAAVAVVVWLAFFR